MLLPDLEVWQAKLVFSVYRESTYSLPFTPCPHPGKLPLEWLPYLRDLLGSAAGDNSKRWRREEFVSPAPFLLGMVGQWPCSSADGGSSCLLTLFYSWSSHQGLQPLQAKGYNNSHCSKSLAALPSLTGSLKSAHTFVNCPFPQLPL